jgi:hypothetical protein
LGSAGAPKMLAGTGADKVHLVIDDVRSRSRRRLQRLRRSAARGSTSAGS